MAQCIFLLEWKTSRDIDHSNIDKPLFTDASGSGWGAVCDNIEAAGKWNTRVAHQSSNYRELNSSISVKCFQRYCEKETCANSLRQYHNDSIHKSPGRTLPQNIQNRNIHMDTNLSVGYETICQTSRRPSQIITCNEHIYYKHGHIILNFGHM